MEINQRVEYIISLAKDVETEDPIDWGMLEIDEEAAYRLVALNVIEAMNDKYDEHDYRDVLLATIVKLVVENFTLNLKLQGKRNGC